jgi:hypothetical protein
LQPFFGQQNTRKSKRLSALRELFPLQRSKRQKGRKKILSSAKNRFQNPIRRKR